MERISKPASDSGKTFVLDLGGQDGNAFALMGITRQLVEQVDGKEKAAEVVKEMMTSDYDHLLTVMCANVGQFIYFENVPEQYGDTLEAAKDGHGKAITFTWGDE
jgi:hypothetical protein